MCIRDSSSAVLGAVTYGVISAIVINALGLADVDFTRAALPIS